MQKGLLFTAVAGLSIMLTPEVDANTGSYLGNPASSYYISAPVIRVNPITTRRTIEHPIRQCERATAGHGRHRSSSHRRNYERHSSEGNYFLQGLFGGLVGGFIGNQFGGGSGKKALTIVGALAGSSIARDAARQHDQSSYPTQVCRTTYETEVIEDISAYDVTYEYGGQQFSKRMTEHPGNSIRVRVEVMPELDGGSGDWQ